MVAIDCTDKDRIRGNRIVDKLQEISDKLREIKQLVLYLPAELRIAGNQINVTTLAEISECLGLIRAGEFRAGNNVDPGKGFTGVRICYPGVIYGTNIYAIIGVNNDVPQFGLRTSDGAGLFAGGLAIIGATAIDINTLNYIIRHTATNAGITRIGKLMMAVPSDSSTPAWMLDLSEPSATLTELVTNGGFETNDFTSWTKTTETYGAWSIVTSPIYAGTYAVKWTPTAEGSVGVLTGSRIDCTAGTNYFCSANLYNEVQYEWANVKIEVKWYDHASAGNLLRTDVMGILLTYNTTGWINYENTYNAPATALSFCYVITATDVI